MNFLIKNAHLQVWCVFNFNKELRETKVSLKILDRAKVGDKVQCTYLIKEAGELAAISGKMILNKQKSMKM